MAKRLPSNNLGKSGGVQQANGTLHASWCVTCLIVTRRKKQAVIRLILLAFCVPFSFWLATSATLPGSNTLPTSPEITWRRTNQGWERANRWLANQEHLRRKPSPMVHPVAVLPMVVVISSMGLMLGQPRTGTRDAIQAKSSRTGQD